MNKQQRSAMIKAMLATFGDESNVSAGDMARVLDAIEDDIVLDARQGYVESTEVAEAIRDLAAKVDRGDIP